MSTPIPSMVEKVAKAIYEKRNGAGCWPWGRHPKSYREPYLADARAAIEAIDADDDAFVRAVGELMHDARFSRSGETYPVVRNFIRALKAVALNEKG